MNERDAHGRFVPGHAPVNPRDKTTGKFLCNQQPVTQPLPPVVIEPETPPKEPEQLKEPNIIKGCKQFKKPDGWG